MSILVKPLPAAAKPMVSAVPTSTGLSMDQNAGALRAFLLISSTASSTPYSSGCLGFCAAAGASSRSRNLVSGSIFSSQLLSVHHVVQHITRQ